MSEQQTPPTYPKTSRAKVTGMWRKSGKNGDFFSGRTAEGVSFTLYPNGYKTNDTHPEYILYTEIPDEAGAIPKGATAVLAVTDVKAPVAK